MRAVSQALRFMSLVLTGLALGLAVAHALEMPAKLQLPPHDYLIVQQIYSAFGAVGALLEPAAVVCAFALAFLARRGRAFRPAMAGALCLVAALLIWVAIVNPVNAHWQAAGSADVPGNFESLRMRWEWGHAARAALVLAGFISVIIAVLTDMATTAAAAVKLTVPKATTSNAVASRTPPADENAADVIVPPDKNAAA